MSGRRSVEYMKKLIRQLHVKSLCKFFADLHSEEARRAHPERLPRNEEGQLLFPKKQLIYEKSKEDLQKLALGLPDSTLSALDIQANIIKLLLGQKFLPQALREELQPKTEPEPLRTVEQMDYLFRYSLNWQSFRQFFEDLQKDERRRPQWPSGSPRILMVKDIRTITLPVFRELALGLTDEVKLAPDIQQKVLRLLRGQGYLPPETESIMPPITDPIYWDVYEKQPEAPSYVQVQKKKEQEWIELGKPRYEEEEEEFFDTEEQKVDSLRDKIDNLNSYNLKILFDNLKRKEGFFEEGANPRDDEEYKHLFSNLTPDQLLHSEITIRTIYRDQKKIKERLVKKPKVAKTQPKPTSQQSADEPQPSTSGLQNLQKFFTKPATNVYSNLSDSSSDEDDERRKRQKVAEQLLATTSHPQHYSPPTTTDQQQLSPLPCQLPPSSCQQVQEHYIKRVRQLQEMVKSFDDFQLQILFLTLSNVRFRSPIRPEEIGNTSEDDLRQFALKLPIETLLDDDVQEKIEELNNLPKQMSPKEEHLETLKKLKDLTEYLRNRNIQNQNLERLFPNRRIRDETSIASASGRNIEEVRNNVDNELRRLALRMDRETMMQRLPNVYQRIGNIYDQQDLQSLDQFASGMSTYPTLHLSPSSSRAQRVTQDFSRLLRQLDPEPDQTGGAAQTSALQSIDQSLDQSASDSQYLSMPRIGFDLTSQDVQQQTMPTGQAPVTGQPQMQQPNLLLQADQAFDDGDEVYADLNQDQRYQIPDQPQPTGQFVSNFQQYQPTGGLAQPVFPGQGPDQTTTGVPVQQLQWPTQPLPNLYICLPPQSTGSSASGYQPHLPTIVLPGPMSLNVGQQPMITGPSVVPAQAFDPNTQLLTWEEYLGTRNRRNQ